VDDKYAPNFLDLLEAAIERNADQSALVGRRAL
jgi:hypothetical protein